MAQNKSGRGTAATKSKNDTPNTPGIDESKIARRKADDLRRELKDRGVGGTADMKKDDLVKRLVKAYKDDAKSGGGSGGGKSGGGKSGGEAAVAKKGAGAKTSGGAKGSAGTKASGIRKGSQTSKSLKYSQEITSTDDRPERSGRSLVTTDHTVIRRWAEARRGVPATVEGTGPGGTLGVLRFDFPGGSGGDRLRQVSWDEWFDTFDRRKLNFIYQEERSDGNRSTFFRLENPEREDA